MSTFIMLVWMLLFFLFVEIVSAMLGTDEHNTIIPEPWDISREEE